jgi:hypothetical protein
LQSVRAGFAAHPEWGASFGDVVYVDGDGHEIYRREEAVYDYNVLRYWNDYICHQTLFVRKSVYQRIGGYNHQDFKVCCDYEFIVRLGHEGVTVGHVAAFLVNFRFHHGGISSNLRVEQMQKSERVRIREKYGCPAGWRGRILSLYYRTKRQYQKIRYRGKCDLVSGRRLLSKHMREKSGFSSNIGLDR